MLRRVFQKVEILNRYCVLSSTILTRVKEPCFEAILIITELNTYLVQVGELARRHPQGRGELVHGSLHMPILTEFSV